MKTFPSESKTYTDRVTGVTVRQLTDYAAHSYHLYFTNPGWWDNGRRLLFGSDRGNASNLFSMELSNGRITQITDNPPGYRGSFQNAYLNPTRDEAFHIADGTVRAIDLHTGRIRTLFTIPDGWGAGNESCTADGKYVVCSLKQKVDIGPVDLGAGYVGFREMFEAHPLCRVIRIRTDRENGDYEVLHEERNWIGHVNASSTQPNLLTFCHEGPWHLVDQRIWGLDMDTKKVWKIRPQVPGEIVGHEYWMTDGKRIGYHGIGTDEVAFYGSCLHDGSDVVEIPYPHDSNHFHSNTPEFVVADGPQKDLTPHVLLSRFDRETRTFDGPRVLCIHRGSRHIQHLHVHPRFSPDGKQVLYTSDPRGYGNLYLVDLPKFESLPKLSELKR